MGSSPTEDTHEFLGDESQGAQTVLGPSHGKFIGRIRQLSGTVQPVLQNPVQSRECILRPQEHVRASHPSLTTIEIGTFAEIIPDIS